MTLAEQRIDDFSSSLKKLDNDSRAYVHGITQALFLFEQHAVIPVFDQLSHGLGYRSMNDRERRFL